MCTLYIKNHHTERISGKNKCEKEKKNILNVYLALFCMIDKNLYAQI